VSKDLIYGDLICVVGICGTSSTDATSAQTANNGVSANPSPAGGGLRSFQFSPSVHWLDPWRGCEPPRSTALPAARKDSVHRRDLCGLVTRTLKFSFRNNAANTTFPCLLRRHIPACTHTHTRVHTNTHACTAKPALVCRVVAEAKLLLVGYGF